MKLCPKCGAPLAPDSNFCTQCGTNVDPVPNGTVFLTRCPKCGFEPERPSQFCIHCGTPMTAQAHAGESQPGSTPPPPPPYAYQNYAPQPVDVVRSLRTRMLVSAVLHLITGICQGIGALILVPVSLLIAIVVPYGYDYAMTYDYEFRHYAAQHFSHGDMAIATVVCVVLLIISLLGIGAAIWNLIVAGKTFSFRKKILTSPVGILEHFHSLGATIALLVVNVCLGGTVGIVASAFGIAARSYVQSNGAQFAALERNFSQKR